MYDLIIIGGGVAGYSAGMYAKRYEMKVLVVSPIDGGTIINTHLVENFPGFESLTGFELAMKIVNHAKNLGTEVVNASVSEIRKESSKSTPPSPPYPGGELGDVFKLKLSNGEEKEAKSVILATGTEHRELGLESEEKFKNKGVSYCATCDGAFFKDKVVGVVGGSDSAVKESLLLSKYASKVYIIYRGDAVKAEPVNIKRMKAEGDKIEVLTKVNVVEILGDEKVTGVKLDRDFKKSTPPSPPYPGGESKDSILELEGLFIEIGRIPQADLAKQIGVDLSERGEVKINRYAETNIEGFFAAGDITDTNWKQAITASAEGAHAANSAFNYVLGRE